MWHEPRRYEELLDPDTYSAGRIKRPLRVALRNLVILVFPMSGVLLALSLKAQVDWRVLSGFAGLVVVFTFGHAYLGARIGGDMASRVLAILLLVMALVGTWVFVNY